MTICYFGIYRSDFGRNRTFIKGLQENGATVLECRDTSSGPIKFWRLGKKFRTLKGKYDAIIVGYPGHLVVPFAKLISSKPVIADLLGSLSDAETLSHRPGFLRRMKSVVADRLAVRFADLILLESEAQKKYFEERFGASEKYRVLYTGADDAVFHSVTVARPDFTVLFRGRLTPESGIMHILKAAALLAAQKDIQFRIIGGGPLLAQVQKYIEEQKLSNVELISEYLKEEELRENMCEASLSLGQFENNPRLSRTIPHKAFESFALGLPYLSADAPAIREIVRDGENGFLVPLANAPALAEKILSLRDNHTLLSEVGRAGKTEYEKRFSPRVLGAALLELI